MMLSHLLGHGDPNDGFARSKGFPDAATMKAYYEKQQAMRTGTSGGPSSGGFLDTIHSALAIHPAILLKSILDKWNQADGTQQ